MTINLEEPGSIVPHKGKMLLLSRILDFNVDEQTLCAEYDVTEDCIFYNPVITGVPAYAGFEFIAQAVSAFSGIKVRMLGEKPKIGYILSVSSMHIDIPFFQAGSTVQVKVKETARMDQVSNYEGEVFFKDKKVIHGKLTVIETNEEI